MSLVEGKGGALRCLLGSTVVCITLIAAWPAAAQPQEQQPQAQPPSTVKLRTINVQSTRRKPRQARQATPPQPAQQPPAPQESAYGPVQGYVANQSATGTKTDTPLREVPQSITVVTAGRARDIGASTVQDATRYIPGVYADPYGPDSRSDAVRVRGSDAEIYLDGLRVQNAYFNWQRVDPYMLSRIEVLRGPSSVLYGSTSTAGLVNMVSKRPQEQELHEFGFQYGSFNRKQFQTDHTGKITDDGTWLYRFVGIGRDSGMQTDFVSDDRIVAMPAVTWRPTASTDWTVMGVYQKDTTGSSTAFLPHSGTILPNPNGQIPVNRFASDPGFDLYRTETKSVISVFEHRFADWFKVRQNFRFSNENGTYNTAYPDNYSNPANPFVNAARSSVFRYGYSALTDRDTLAADTSAEAKFATGPVAHKVLMGIDHRRIAENRREGYSYDTTPFNLFAPTYTAIVRPVLAPTPDLDQRQTGAYVQDQLRLGRWIVVAGLRHDRVMNDVEGLLPQVDRATTGRIGVMYELPFGLTPYASYGTSFNPIFGSGICRVFCKPQEGEQYEVGFKYRADKSLTINGAVFDVTEKNRLAADPTNPFLSIQTGRVGIRGAELEVLATVARDLDLIGAYTYLDTEVLEGDNAGKHIETVPAHMASLWARYRFALFGLSGFAVGAGVRYIGDSWDGADTLRTPSHTLFDAMLSWENKNWRWQLNGTNLADNIHVTTCLARGDCFYGARRAVLSTLTYRY